MLSTWAAMFWKSAGTTNDIYPKFWIDLVHERMNEQTNEWTNEWMNEWVNEWMNEMEWMLSIDTSFFSLSTCNSIHRRWDSSRTLVCNWLDHGCQRISWSRCFGCDHFQELSNKKVPFFSRIVFFFLGLQWIFHFWGGWCYTWPVSRAFILMVFWCDVTRGHVLLSSQAVFSYFIDKSPASLESEARNEVGRSHPDSVASGKSYPQQDLMNPL